MADQASRRDNKTLRTGKAASLNTPSLDRLCRDPGYSALLAISRNRQFRATAWSSKPARGQAACIC
ncbi:MAG: hypothetical protein Q8M37_04520 [Nevskia sp.]|nr:hypothetical protein [Nevskia sp.]